MNEALSYVQERRLGWLAGFLAASFGASSLGWLFTNRSLRAWYPTLRKPSWTPPDWVFGPVWTVLYTMMALSAWLVRRHMEQNASRSSWGKAALAAWAMQLALNAAWSFVFFGRQHIAGGVWVIGALWLAIAACAALAAQVTRLGSYLLLPYLAWVSFASAINVRLWQLNRGR